LERGENRLQIKVPQRIVITPPVQAGPIRVIYVDENGRMEITNVWGQTVVRVRLETS